MARIIEMMFFEIRFQGGRTQANGAFAGSADLVAAVLRQSLPRAQVLVTERDIRIRWVTRPVELPEVFIQLRNSIRGLTNIDPQRLERARREALGLIEARVSDDHAQFDDRLNRLGLRMTGWETADWTRHAEHLRNVTATRR